jgi:ATPase family associated with various cellular activities (AAA)
MDIKTIKQVTPILLKHGIVPYWHGMQGVGKTTVARSLGKTLGFDADASDVIGLLDKENGKHFHTRPDWMPTSGKHLIFLDEFNRANGEIYQIMYTFLTEGRIKNHRLPPGCAIIAAANYDSNDFTVSNTRDKALRSRFCHLHFVPSVNEIADFIESGGSEGDKEVAKFLRVHPEMAGHPGGTMNISPDPDPRAWQSKIAPLFNEDLGEARFEVYAGIIGTAPAATFMAFNKRAENPLNIEDICTQYKYQRDRVLGYANVKNDRRFDALNVPVDQLISKLESEPKFLEKPSYVDNLKLFIMDLPLELIMKLVNAISKLTFHGRDKILDDNEYTEQLADLMAPKKKVETSPEAV